MAKSLQDRMHAEETLRGKAGVAIDPKDMVKVINPQGKTVLIPRRQLPNAIVAGKKGERYKMPFDPLAYQVTAPPITMPKNIDEAGPVYPTETGGSGSFYP
jgi:hypothetical protein